MRHSLESFYRKTKEAMTFRDSQIVRPLYDTLNGGPPRAFACQYWEVSQGQGPVSGWGPPFPRDSDGSYYICGKITRTERGMRQHLARVHNFEPQGDLFRCDATPESR